MDAPRWDVWGGLPLHYVLGSPSLASTLSCTAARGPGASPPGVASSSPRSSTPNAPVAIKVLDPEIATVLGPERWLREVDLASKLTHRHIAPVHAARDATDQANDPRSSSLMNLQQLPLHADMP
jgi:hypothetical protein